MAHFFSFQYQDWMLINLENSFTKYLLLTHKKAFFLILNYTPLTSKRKIKFQGYGRVQKEGRLGQVKRSTKNSTVNR